jgi:predicted ribosome quality control (RQC) complex YloA/Tae2 family protein
MSNVDIFAVCHELNELLQGARVDKSFQPTKDTVVIKFHKSGTGRVDVVFQAGVRCHKSEYPLDNPTIPPSFPMLLRKKLKGAHVVSIKQHNFDRVIILELEKEEKYSLIIELFSKGNIILLNEEKNIIMPLKRKQWSDRDISSKKEYKFPQTKGINPLTITKEELKELFTTSEDDLIRTLAKNGLGSTYSEEIILRTKLNKNMPSKDLSTEEITIVYEKMEELFNPLKNNEFKANIVLDKEINDKTENIDNIDNNKNNNENKETNEDEKNSKREEVFPLELELYKDYPKEYFDSFNQAADEFYSTKVRKDLSSVHESVWNKKVGKYSKRLKLQEENLKDFEDTIEISKKKGELLYSNYLIIEGILKVIHQAREKDFPYKEIAKTLKKAKKDGMKDAEIFESMDTLGNLVLDIEGVKIAIDSKKTIDENASTYYEKGKKSKRKIKGALIAIENTKKQLKDMENKKEIAMEKIELPKKRIKKPLKWYEKLRWFISSDNHLVVGGRDANTNEEIYKKYMENNDIYLHADIHGAPSTVIKKGDSEITEETLKESAIFAVSFSSAWAKGYGSGDVYWVHPEQVSKTPESGEFLTKGSFVVRGKRNHLKGVNIKIAIGIIDYEGKRVMAGPVDSVKAHTDNYVIIKPGYEKKEKIAKEILHKINQDSIIDLDDVVRVLPSGKCEIIKEKR